VRRSFHDRAFPAERVLRKDLGDESILLDLSTETYFGLNASGRRLWELLTTRPSIGDAFDAFLAEFDVDEEQLERDLDALIDDLVSRGLLRTGHA
jgi:hypothetical protein